MIEHIPFGYEKLYDSAFPHFDSQLRGKTVRTRKHNEKGANGDIPQSSYSAAIDLLLEKALPSEPQSAKWVVEAFNRPSKRFKIPLLVDVYTRLRIISTNV